MDMSNAMREQRQFLMKMVVFAAILLVVSLIACVFQLRKMCTVPLEMLAEATRGFADSDHGFTEENIIDLPITANDEIGDLYQVIRSMQIKIVQYLDNLTRVTAEKERISAELNIAAQIQVDMLPRSFPPFPERHDFDIYATMDPAKEVGGDFYDFFLIDSDHLGLVMADVSGKGVPASLFMVNTKTLIKNRAMMGGSPAEILDYVNNQLCEGNEAEMFVTVWLAIVELSTGKGMAANAGHEHPTLRHRDGRYELVIYRHSLALATFEGLHFKEHSFELKPGDSLFVYTDGVTEATDAENRLFGTERMLEALNREPNADPKTLLGNVKTEIDAFVGSAPQFDDITMLCMQYNGPEETA
jgi:sigma-B regulation protein RsbU (phosphoserine phosphatase)